ncbi:hypothetical protein LIG30_1471 [Burkholderia sp. lig30]|uniref:hypothetical protein n=1 Tax=Burkholderia sp. lig30 TaxID=1192124 RepID=UPI000460D8EA|nr:hypothetical protein [Burkholderia sp. lig30]KDB09499.1 hypothetical protein LIG30_1471 [Burkholderia sp. lig30]
MQFIVDGKTILTAVIGALWFITIAACGAWIKRVSSDRKELRDDLQELADSFAQYRETVAREYAQRSEVRDERNETREMFVRIEAKINELYNHVMGKK